MKRAELVALARALASAGIAIFLVYVATGLATLWHLTGTP